MAKPKRLKAPAADAPQSRDEVANLIKELGDLQREALRAETVMNDAIAEITQAHAPAIAARQAQIEDRLVRVQSWCESNRTDLTRDGEVKSANLVTGEIGWRTDPPSVRVSNADEVILRLDELDLAEAWTRSKREVNKEAILADRSLSNGEDSPAKDAALARLAKLAEIAGLNISAGKEKFFVVPFEQQVEAG